MHNLVARLFGPVAGLLLAATLLSACKTSEMYSRVTDVFKPDATTGIIAEDTPEIPAPVTEAEPIKETEAEADPVTEAEAETELAATDEAAAAAGLPVPQSSALPAPTAATSVPHIYMAIQPDGEGKPISAIFAIDAARDNTPSDDPAIRLTPENGQCNPHEMRTFTFPPDAAAHPVITDADKAQGLTVANLPAFMAVSVTNKMLEDGLASNREETRALNICTRKLWEELVLSENQPAAAAGQ